MEKWLKDISPIMDVEHDCILSKQGDISIVFKAFLPEVFTQSPDNYEALHQGLIKAIKVLPVATVFHKQDWFIQSNYQADFEKTYNSFLTRSSERFFNERAFLQHDCYIFLTKTPSGRKASSSIFSSLLRPTMVPDQTIHPGSLHEFEDTAG